MRYNIDFGVLTQGECYVEYNIEPDEPAVGYVSSIEIEHIVMNGDELSWEDEHSFLTTEINWKPPLLKANDYCVHDIICFLIVEDVKSST